MNQKIIIPRLANSSQAELNKLVDSINLSLKDLYGNIGTPASAPTVSSGTGQLEREVLVDKGPQTAITIDTLDGLAHGGYRFEFFVVNPGQAVTYSLYFNNDQTPTHYYASMHRSGEVHDNNFYNNAMLMPLDANSTFIFVSGVIEIAPNGVAVATFSSIQGFYYHYKSDGAIWKSATIANLTRLDIVSSVANGIGVYSRFRLWRMN